jgi:two-component system cell cycle sensor histidine kinase/response regulator CckA
MCNSVGKGLHYDIDEAGVWVDCVHERKPVIHNDYSALPHRKGMPAGHANVVRELVVPVRRDDRFVAILGVGNKPVDYGTSDIETVSLLADLAWDIAQRKLAEEALRAASLYNRSLIEASLDPLVTISAEGKITDVNSATERITGYSRDHLLGTDFADYFADPQKARDGYERAFKKGMVEDYELEIRHRDGHLTPVVYNASVYHDSSAEIVGLFAAARDISQRKQAEEKNLWMAAIVESSDDAIIGKTLDGLMTSWNKGAANLYGYTDAEAVGQPISLLVPPDRQDEVSQLLEKIKRGEHVEHYETVRRTKKGRAIDISLTISPIRNPEGEIIGASTIARDITAQKSLQRQLLQAQKMEAIGTLAGGIAHDFNNLLTVVLGFSELLLIGKDERDPAQEDLQKINEAARKGAELVQRILAFSRKTEINPRPLNLNREIQQVKKLLVRTIPKMIEIELALSGELATVNADPVQIEQVLMNLAVNAKDAMPDGGTLTIETKNVALDEEYCRMHLGAIPGDYVLLSVSDTGHGMDKETLNHIFEPFYTTKGVGRGTGLGLAMVYGIVKQHGGYTTCYSELAVGTVFKIYLPVVPTEAQSEIRTEKPRLSRGTETILLVDDEEHVRELGKRVLEKYGYTVLTAASGKQALVVYEKNKDQISLVILDLIMPEMGGRECLERLLKIEPLAKVLIASGYAAEGQTKEGIETGAKGFVGKPFDMRQMLHTVREVLDSN